MTMPPLSTTVVVHPDGEWIMTGFKDQVPGVSGAVLVSVDGLALRYAGMDRDSADRLSALASGLHSIGLQASLEFGGGRGISHASIDFYDGMLLVTHAGDLALLACVITAESDPGIVGHEMRSACERLAPYLSTPPRQNAPS